VAGRNCWFVQRRGAWDGDRTKNKRQKEVPPKLSIAVGWIQRLHPSAFELILPVLSMSHGKLDSVVAIYVECEHTLLIQDCRVLV